VPAVGLLQQPDRGAAPAAKIGSFDISFQLETALTPRESQKHQGDGQEGRAGNIEVLADAHINPQWCDASFCDEGKRRVRDHHRWTVATNKGQTLKWHQLSITKVAQVASE
jgi:hypothetical protein